MAVLFKKYLPKDKALKLMIDELTMYGEMVIQEAFKTANFNKKRTQNLRDSYASAVFYEGKMVNGTMRTLGSPLALVDKKWHGRKVRGRNEATRFLRNDYKPTGHGLSLVAIAAMPYREVLELRYKYRVISGANWMMRSLAHTFSTKFGVRRHGITISNINV
jgi:hypothetical protein